MQRTQPQVWEEAERTRSVREAEIVTNKVDGADEGCANGGINICGQEFPLRLQFYTTCQGQEEGRLAC